jgi:hypothetical protein
MNAHPNGREIPPRKKTTRQEQACVSATDLILNIQHRISNIRFPGNKSLSPVRVLPGGLNAGKKD